MASDVDISSLKHRLQSLVSRGVNVVDPRQTFVAEDVDATRLAAGSVLHPGARLYGPRTLLCAGAEVGREGPATVKNVAMGPRARIDSGFAEGAVLLADARLGANAHVRPGTLLEEQASTAHAVGLKHTILLSFVTLGSLVNFCDVLMAGGTSREDHSEVGSGFIHFNFTPWGERGDKATPSLIGDVVDGVFLRRRRIFVGGCAGLVGPNTIGYGAITAAGQVMRKPVPGDRLVLQAQGQLDMARTHEQLDRAQPRRERNLDYIAQVVALRVWYRTVRLAMVPSSDALERALVEAAIDTLTACIDERVERLGAFLKERGDMPAELDLEPAISCPLHITQRAAGTTHLDWVCNLAVNDVANGRAWLQQIVAAVDPNGTS